jgi:hypothetical protein
MPLLHVPGWLGFKDNVSNHVALLSSSLEENNNLLVNSRMEDKAVKVQ